MYVNYTYIFQLNRYQFCKVCLSFYYGFFHICKVIFRLYVEIFNLKFKYYIVYQVVTGYYVECITGTHLQLAFILHKFKFDGNCFH